MTDHILAADEAILARLASDPALVEVSGRIFIEKAPGDAKTPYIIISLQSDRELDRTTVNQVAIVYNVRAVVDVDAQNARKANELAALIRARLHRQPFDVEGWGMYWCKRRTGFRFLNTHERRNYAVAGGLYEIGMTEDG